jgi:hypothetical protein
MNPYVHLVEGGAEVMDGVARSTQKIKEIIDGVARSSYKIKQKDVIASMILEDENDVAENSSDSTWVSTESATGAKEVVKEVVDEVGAEVENEKGEKGEVEEKEVVKEKQIEKEEGEKRRYSVQEAVKEVEKGIKSDRRRSSIAPSTQNLSNKNTSTEMKAGTKVNMEMERKMEEGMKDKVTTGSVREIHIKEEVVKEVEVVEMEEGMKDKVTTGSVREIHIKEEVVKEEEVVQEVMESSNADGTEI